MFKASEFASVAVLALAMMFALPGVAHAKRESVSGTVCTRGTWTNDVNPRTKRHAGDITLTLINDTSGTLYISLRGRRAHDAQPFSVTTEFPHTGTKHLATDVPAGTTFHIRARMTEIPGGDNHWAGRLTY